jgi:hypothetical protein
MSTPTTWNSGGSTDANNAANYSAGLPADAVVTLDATSVVDWIFTANMSVESVTIAAAYSGAVALTGYTLTVALGISFDGTGTYNLGNGITANGNNSTVHFGAGMGLVTATSCVLTMNGTTAMVLDDDKTTTFRSLTLGIGAVVTNSGGGFFSTYLNAGIPLTLGNNSTFTNNNAISLISSTSNDIWSIGTGVTVNGNGNYSIRGAAAGIIITIPELTYTGTGSFNFQGVSLDYTFTQTGNLNFGNSSVELAQVVVGVSNIIYNTGDFNITCGILRTGVNGGQTGSTTVNFGNSIISCTAFDGSTRNNAGQTQNDNFQTSQWSCSGNWAFGSNHTITHIDSQVTITNTSTITSNGKSFFDLTINAAARVVTCADALTCAAGGDLTLTAGTLTLATFNLTVGGNTAVNGTSTLNVTASTCSFAGNYTTAAGCTVTINAATNYTFTAAAVVTTNGIALPQCTFNAAFSLNDSCTVAALIYGVDGITGTYEAGQTFVISALVAANWSGSAGALNAFRSSVPGTQYSFTIPNGVVLSYVNPQDSNLTAAFQIDCMDGTSVNGGNNDPDWLFPAGGVGQRISESKISIALGI